jgi:hypothetical protein
LEQGLTSEQAEVQALATEEDWTALGYNIRKAVYGGSAMASWKRSFWIPGLVTIALYAVTEMAVGRYHWVTAHGMGPHGVLLISVSALQMVVMRNVVPILAGALGAAVSMLMKGNLWQRLLAALVPSLTLPALTVLMLAVSLLRGFPTHFVWAHSMLRYRLVTAVSLKYISYLLLGAFPFLVFGDRRKLAPLHRAPVGPLPGPR